MQIRMVIGVDVLMEGEVKYVDTRITFLST